jgi:hypothetical protein
MRVAEVNTRKQSSDVPAQRGNDDDWKQVE